MIREVRLSDAEQICSIYNYYIEHSIATFDEQIKDSLFFEEKIKLITQNYPWFVLEVEGEINAFAYASQWKDKSAYNKSVEGTVYVKNMSQEKGLGEKIYTHLIDSLRNKGFHSVVGVISLPNNASISLHEKLGFEKVAHFKEIGNKFNQMIDVACWQLLI